MVKYQGLGNDFLVALDGRGLDAAARERGAARAGPARRLRRDRRARSPGRIRPGAVRRAIPASEPTGFSILRTATSGGDVRMELRNADGSRAETSGNGLRCFALAVVRTGLVDGPEVYIETDAGLREAVLRSQDGPGCADVSVEMGRLLVTPLSPVADGALPGSVAQPWPAWFVDAGNPHLVVLAPCSGGRRDRGGRPARSRLSVPVARTWRSWPVSPARRSCRSSCGSAGPGSRSLAGAGAWPRPLPSIPRGSATIRSGSTTRVGWPRWSSSGDDPLAVLATLAGPVRRVARVEVDPAELGGPGAVVVAS